MSEPAKDVHSEPDAPATFWSKHRFMLLIIGAIFISLSLVAISMSLYINSGAAQLDLSRPGYEDVQDQVEPEDEALVNYPTTGPINKDTVKDFTELYDEQLEKAKSIEAFGGDPLSSAALGID